MAIKMIKVKCPECGGTMDIGQNRDMAYCTYCGTKIMIHNENEKISLKDFQLGFGKDIKNNFVQKVLVVKLMLKKNIIYASKLVIKLLFYINLDNFIFVTF